MRIQSAGFTIVEVLVAMTMALIMMMAVASFQLNVAKENRALSEKMDAIEAGRQISLVMADEKICSCNVKDTAVSTGADGKLKGMVASGRLTTECGGGTVLAQVNSALSATEKRFPAYVKEISLAELVARPSVGGDTLYDGVIQIDLQPTNPANANQKMIRAIQPVKVRKTFIGAGGNIRGCGMHSKEVTTIIADTERANGPEDKYNVATSSIAYCPPGMIAIGGGWEQSSTGTVGGCPPDKPYAAVLKSHPLDNLTGWLVWAACVRFKATVTCFRPTFAR
jgi:type II secretory pathway pseudopilin PulG